MIKKIIYLSIILVVISVGKTLADNHTHKNNTNEGSKTADSSLLIKKGKIIPKWAGPLIGSWKQPDGRIITLLENRYYTFDKSGQLFDNGRLSFDEKEHRFYWLSLGGRGTFQIEQLTNKFLSAKGTIREKTFGYLIQTHIEANRVPTIILPPPVKELPVAAQHGDVETVAVFLKNGFHIDKKDSVGVTALHYAAYHCHSDAVAFLLEKGADKAILTDNNKSSIRLAIEADHVEAVKLLLGAGVKIDSADTKEKSLLESAVHQSDEMIITLLEHGANPKDKSRYGHVLLDLLMAEINSDFQYSERLAITNYVFENGLYGLNEVDDHGQSPIFWAANKDLIKTVRYLIDEGARLDLRDNQGLTLLEYAKINSSLSAEMIALIESESKNNRK